MDASEPKHRPLLALGIRLAAIAALATMSALVKLAGERGVHLLEILFWRQFVTIPIALGWVMATGGLAMLRTDRPRTHAKRALYGMVGMILNFGGLLLLPLAEATTMGFTAPIWAVILSTLLLGEKVGVYRWGAVALGFAGVLVIAQPGGGHIPLFGAAAALSGAFMVALISIQIADLNRTDKPLTIVFWFAAISTATTVLALPFVSTSHDAGEWALLIGIGIVGGAGQLLLTSALRVGKVASVIVMDYSSLFWATLYGWTIWNMLPPTSTWVGVPLIVAAGLVIAWREHRLARPSNRDVARVEGT
ncbi:DMT family transporter [Altericroceibacterium xinjiangense]|uniref:DMT family transporter n=1 Tax=Altericroceibacterium xinjiangense TaxID=762261 RepID=UPI000F7F9D18|nr:DMT family transporter [Altericroceibacterium xinjiangense]